MAAPFLQQLPAYDGTNWAPLKPFLALQERNGHNSPYAQHPLTEAIKKKYEEKIKDKELAWREMIQVGQMIALFIEGKQILDWNPYSNAWTPRKLSRSDPNRIKAVNFMQYYSTNWQSKWGSSNPDVITAARSNKDQDIARARKANAVVNFLERDMYGRSGNSWYKYHEGMLAQVFGWYGNRVRLCHKTGRVVQRPIVENRPVTLGQGYGQCHDCGYQGSQFDSLQISQTDSMPTCPNCGSTGVMYTPPVTQDMPTIAGTEPFRLPRVIAEQLPFPACRWDIRYRMEDSPWALFEQDIDPNMLRHALGDLRIPEGESGNNIGLDAMVNLAGMGAPVGGRSEAPQTRRKDGMVLTEMYLSADDLYDVPLSGDEETVDGQMLPAGSRGSDFWPNGACFVGINGFALLWGVYGENHADAITSGVWHLKPMSGTGRGAADAVEIQKRFNRFDSQVVRWMQVRATPATLHAEGAIPANKLALLGQPDANIPIQLQNFPEVRSVNDLISPLQGESIPGDMLQYTYQHLQSFMQLAYHITDFSNGLNPRVRNDTATGAEILDANADAVFHPALDIKAEVTVETARKAFELWVKSNPVRQFVPLKSAAKSGARGLDISGPEVEGDYDWSYQPGSQVPKNRLTKRRDMTTFYSLFGGIIGYLQAKQTNPQEVAEVERAFDMDFATNDFDEIGDVCRTRLEFAKNLLDQTLQLKDATEQMLGVTMPDPNPMYILPEVHPSMLVTESDHPQKAAWFSRLLDTTEGQEMTPLERNLVSAFVQGHMMLAQGQELALRTAATETEVGAAGPAVAAEDQRNAATAEADHARSQQTADVEHQRSLETADVAHRQNLERDNLAAKRDMQKEKLRTRQAA